MSGWNWKRKADLACCQICVGQMYVKDPEETMTTYRTCESCTGTGLDPIPFTEVFKDLRRQWAGVMQVQLGPSVPTFETDTDWSMR